MGYEERMDAMSDFIAEHSGDCDNCGITCGDCLENCDSIQKLIKKTKTEEYKRGKIAGMKKMVQQYEFTHSNIIAEIIVKNRLEEKWIPKTKKKRKKKK